MSTQHQPLTLYWYFLLLLFYHMLIFSNGPNQSLEFVQYLEFAFHHVPCYATVPYVWVFFTWILYSDVVIFWLLYEYLLTLQHPFRWLGHVFNCLNLLQSENIVEIFYEKHLNQLVDVLSYYSSTPTDFVRYYSLRPWIGVSFLLGTGLRNVKKSGWK